MLGVRFFFSFLFFFFYLFFLACIKKNMPAVVIGIILIIVVLLSSISYVIVTEVHRTGRTTTTTTKTATTSTPTATTDGSSEEATDSSSSEEATDSSSSEAATNNTTPYVQTQFDPALVLPITTTANATKRLLTLTDVPAGTYDVYTTANMDLTSGLDAQRYGSADVDRLYNTLSIETTASTQTQTGTGAASVLRINAGAYNTGAITHAGHLIFDAQNNADAWFIIRIQGAHTVAATASMSLRNQAQINNIFWIVEGALTLADTAHVIGNYLVKDAITLTAKANLQGRLCRYDNTDGAITLGTTANLSIPTGPLPSFALGALREFVVFNRSGNITMPTSSMIPTGLIACGTGTKNAFGSASAKNFSEQVPTAKSITVIVKVSKNDTVVESTTRTIEFDVSTYVKMITVPVATQVTVVSMETIINAQVSTDDGHVIAVTDGLLMLY
jgi:hypothetical protein